MNFVKSVEAFLEFGNSTQGWSLETLRAYRSDLFAVGQFIRGNEPLSDLNVQDWLEPTTELALESYFATKRDTWTPATAQRKWAAIRSWQKFALRSGWLARPLRSTSHRLLRVERKIPQLLGVEEVLETLNLLRDLHTEASDRGYAIRDYALLQVLYGSGLRIGEASKMVWHHVDLQSGWIEVEGKGQKQRHVPLTPAAIEALNQWKKWRERDGIATFSSGADAPVWTAISGGVSALHVRSLARMVVRAWSRAHARVGIHPHLLRHAYATHMMWAGADLRAIQTLLGHASIQTTERYTHWDQETLREAFLGSLPEWLKPQEKG